MILIDTDILIWLLRGHNAIKNDFVHHLETTRGNLHITPIQIAEIYAGVKENEIIKTQVFLDSLKLIDIDSKCGILAGKYMKMFKKTHNVLMADALIAASAVINELDLWTLNKKHYPMDEINLI